MTWADLVAGYLAHLRARGRARRTREQAFLVLGRFEAFCAGEPGAVRLEHLAAWRKALRSGGCSEWTADGYLSRVRGLFRWAWRRGHVLLDPSLDLELSRLPRRLPRVLTARQVEGLLALPDASSPLGLRDLAVLETLYGTGVRLAECERLELRDLDLPRRRLEVRQGKGGRPRVLPVGGHLAGVLARWLEEGRPHLPGDAPALFLNQYGRPLGRTALGRLVARFGRKAGLAPLSPHRLRHAFATHLLEGGADLRHIQALLGHRSQLATELYTRVRPVELFALVRRCHPRARRKSPGPALPDRPLRRSRA